MRLMLLVLPLFLSLWGCSGGGSNEPKPGEPDPTIELTPEQEAAERKLK
jgi:hypothetical protein